jgi:transposase
MKKSIPDRQYTDEFREAAVKQVVDGGRTIRQVARALEMSAGTLGNWVARARNGQVLSKRLPGGPVNELEAEVSRLRQEVARLKVEKEILKKAAAYFAKESM